MYPTIYDLVLDLFGLSWEPLRMLKSYGTMVGLGFVCGSFLMAWELGRKMREGQMPATVSTRDKKGKMVEKAVDAWDHVGNITMLACIGGMVGAKVFHLLENTDKLMANPKAVLMSFSGLSYYGGMICAIALIIWYARKKKLPVLHLLDAGIPALALGYGFGRLGCQVSGDGDWGIPNDSPKPDWLSFLPDWMWAYDYPNNVLGVDLIEHYASKGYVSLTGFAYPTPVYEIIMSIMMFAFLWANRRRWKVPGIMLSAYLVLAGVERILIEQIRINNTYDILGGVTQAEIVSVVIIIMGTIGLILLPRYRPAGG